MSEMLSKYQPIQLPNKDKLIPPYHEVTVMDETSNIKTGPGIKYFFPVREMTPLKLTDPKGTCNNIITESQSKPEFVHKIKKSGVIYPSDDKIHIPQKDGKRDVLLTPSSKSVTVESLLYSYDLLVEVAYKALDAYREAYSIGLDPKNKVQSEQRLIKYFEDNLKILFKYQKVYPRAKAGTKVGNARDKLIHFITNAEDAVTGLSGINISGPIVAAEDP